MLEPATKLVGAYLVPVESAAKICPWTVGAEEVPVPPFDGVRALVRVKPLKLGEAVVLKSWLIFDVPLTVKVFVPKDKVPVPAEIVLPLTVVTVKLVMVVVAKVDVALTVSPLAVVKVNSEEVAMGLVPLPNRISLAVMFPEPVPPLVTGRIPLTWEPKATALL